MSLQHLEPSVRETTKNIPMASQRLSDVRRATEEATHKGPLPHGGDPGRAGIAGESTWPPPADASASGGDGLLPALDAINATTDRTKEKADRDHDQSLVSRPDGAEDQEDRRLVQEVEAKILELILSFGLRPDEKGNDTDRQKRVEDDRPAATPI